MAGTSILNKREVISCMFKDISGNNLICKARSELKEARGFADFVSKILRCSVSCLKDIGDLSSGLKRLVRASKHSSLLVPVLRMRGAVSPFPYVFTLWCLIKHTDNFMYVTLVLLADSYLIQTKQGRI